jgi:hypothetical protein
MESQPWWAAGVDLGKASSARVYDAHLGGSHNFHVDREVADEAARLMPTLPAVLRSNRSFLRRAVRFLVQQGITQFLDLGSGIPTVGNVHEIAQAEDPRCRIVYVDSDLVAVAHSQALLRDNERATSIRADLRDPEDVLTRPETTGLLDLNQPVAVLLIAVLHFVSDEDDPWRIVSGYCDRMASGSHLAISHATKDPERSTRQAADRYSQRIGGFWLRSPEEISTLFAGLPLLEPGLVFMDDWRPDADPLPEMTLVHGRAGVARKP